MYAGHFLNKNKGENGACLRVLSLFLGFQKSIVGILSPNLLHPMLLPPSGCKDRCSPAAERLERISSLTRRLRDHLRREGRENTGAGGRGGRVCEVLLSGGWEVCEMLLAGCGRASTLRNTQHPLPVQGLHTIQSVKASV